MPSDFEERREPTDDCDGDFLILDLDDDHDDDDGFVDLNDGDSIKLDEEFRDSNLALYPAIRIQETHFTIEQYETIANNLIRMMASGRKSILIEALRGLAQLAYNTLMDPIDEKQGGKKPLFIKYKNILREDWMRTERAKPKSINLKALLAMQPPELQQQIGLTLELVDPNASEFQRKSSIGVWALRYLRALRQNSGRALYHYLRYADIPVDQNSFTKSYGFRISYRFPLLHREVYDCLLEECMKTKPGELLYLFYKGAILLERTKSVPELEIQRQLLLQSVFDGKNGLRYIGLNLWWHCREAAEELCTPIEQLIDDLEWTLKDSPWIQQVNHSLEVIDAMKQFCRRYLRVPDTSQYYMYAPVVDHLYFQLLNSSSCKELIHALSLLTYSGLFKEMWTESPYREWGRWIAERIREQYHLASLDEAQLEAFNHNPVKSINWETKDNVSG